MSFHDELQNWPADRVRDLINATTPETWAALIENGWSLQRGWPFLVAWRSWQHGSVTLYNPSLWCPAKRIGGSHQGNLGA